MQSEHLRRVGIHLILCALRTAYLISVAADRTVPVSIAIAIHLRMLFAIKQEAFCYSTEAKVDQGLVVSRKNWDH